jgi:methionyl-tRNA formyltransferase
MGTPDFAVPSLKFIEKNYNIVAVYSQPARPSGRGMRTKLSPVEKAAKELNLKTITPSTLKEDDVFLKFEKLNPDLVVVVAYGLLLPEKFLLSPKFGCINGHASLLPRWRGAAPIQRAIEAGDHTTGSCIMLMEKGMDTGPILSSKSININPSDTSKTIHDKLSNLTAEMLVKTIKEYIDGKVIPIKQKEDGVKYADKIVKDEAIINWSLPSINIFNKVRAFDPFPSTYTFLSGVKIKIVETKLCKESHQFEPGTIIECNNKIIVACGNKSTLEIKYLQKSGKNIMSVKDFLNGTKISVGEKFGS